MSAICSLYGDQFAPLGRAALNHRRWMFEVHAYRAAWRQGAERVPGERQVLRCFVVPRGVTVMAGGTVEPTATSGTLVAEGGSEPCGICSNRFLERAQNGTL